MRHEKYIKSNANQVLFPQEIMSQLRSEHALQKEIIKRIKQFTRAKYVALYLYTPTVHDYEIVQVDEETKHTYKRFLFLDRVIDRSVIDQQELTIYNGAKAFLASLDICTYLVPIQQYQTPIGYLLLGFSNSTEMTTNSKRILQQVCKETYNILSEKSNYVQTTEKANKYELMYRVTKKFHSTMNPTDVLAEVVNTIQSIYPEFTCNLFLSRDYKNEKKLPVKELIYNEEFADKLSVQAFLTGEMKVEQNRKKHRSHLFAPLRGKQGIYGVLQIKVHHILEFQADDRDFIRILADTAGNALENAQLYQQSNQLISDLQLINEITHKLNTNLRLSDTANYLKEQLMHSFQVEEIAFILFHEENSGYTLLEESSPFFHGESLQWFNQEIFPAIKKEKEAIFVGDFSKKYPTCNIDLKSVMIMPMIQSDQLKGVIIILHHQPNFFSFDDFKLMRSIVHHSTLAFVNSLLQEQLEKSVITDYLTKLYSRKYLDEKCNAHLQKGKQGVFLLIDIDDFKQINDSFGHEVGDELIIQVANIIRKNIEEPGFAARWGGEELAVYLPEMDIEEGMQIASQLVICIEEKTNPRITVSIGIAYWHQINPEKMQTIFDRADRSLYEAKRLGKNGVAKVT